MSEQLESNNQNYWWVIIIAALVIIGLVLLVICLANKSPSESDGCKSAEYPSKAENMSSDPNVVEVSLTASDNEVQILGGNTTRLYNYNKSFPGPLIEAKVGDELVVHFFNDISEPSTITWHGLKPDANMDGSVISQLPVMPGESFDYRFYLDTAGLFWYHSDINSREQVHKGLYGVVLVRDYDEDECYSLPTSEKILAFSDLKLGKNNQVDISYSDDACVRTEQQINGILGNVLLTNGVHDGCISVTKNEPTRLRMVNCATDRFMKIVIEGHDMLRIGGDQGLLERPILIKQDSGLILTTGERADVVFVPRQDSVRIYTYNPRGFQHVEKDCDGNCELIDKVSFSDEKELLVTLEARESSDLESLNVPLELKHIKKIKVDQCTPVIPVSFGNFEPDEKGDVDFFAFKQDKHGVPFDCISSEEAPIVVEDCPYIIEVTNYSSIANNFFLHGFSFQHLDTLKVTSEGVEREINKVLENKDTIYIPPRPEGYKSKTVVRLAVKFTGKCRDINAFGKEPTECTAGGWIFQSHILTHAERGQKGFVQIIGECDRIKYSSYSGYSNSYSKYSSGDHSVCLSKSGKSRDYGSKSLSESLDEITKSLITCSCGSGMSVSICSCSRSKTHSASYSSDSSSDSESSRETRRSRYSSKSHYSSSDYTDSKSLTYPKYNPPSSYSKYSMSDECSYSGKSTLSDSSMYSTKSCSKYSKSTNFH